jgi:hypothetical protein
VDQHKRDDADADENGHQLERAMQDEGEAMH